VCYVHSQAAGTNDSTPVEANRVTFGEFSLDVEAHRLYASDGGEISITSREFDLLKAFAENPDKVLSRGQLLTLAHHRDWDSFDRSIDIHIARLRRKLEKGSSKETTARLHWGQNTGCARPPA